MGKIKKVIFDNDGVNIDSEHVAMGDMAEFGYLLVSSYIDPETAELPDGTIGLTKEYIYTNYKGQSSDAIIRSLVEHFDLPVDSIREDYNVPENADLGEFLSNLHTKSVIDKFKTELFTLPGVVETWKILRERFVEGFRAICTTSREDRMHASKHAIDPETGQNAGWEEMFPDIDNLRLSGYGHANKYIYLRKLHPDWDPEETAVVEDTAGSTRKAIEAGFENVIGIVASKFQILDDEGNYSREKQLSEIQKLKEAGAKIVVTDYRDIPAAIDWIDNGMDMNNIPDFISEVHNSNSLEAHNQVFGPSPSGAFH
jgi:beta-phosphoglucomutase-like phosphatase (HAD superfamily)